MDELYHGSIFIRMRKELHHAPDLRFNPHSFIL